MARYVPGRRDREYTIGDMTFRSSREGADYVELTPCAFLRRYRDYKNGIITAEEALRKGRKTAEPKGKAKWGNLTNKERPQNFASLPVSTPFERDHFPVPPAATGSYKLPQDKISEQRS